MPSEEKPRKRLASAALSPSFIGSPPFINQMFAENDSVGATVEAAEKSRDAGSVHVRLPSFSSVLEPSLDELQRIREELPMISPSEEAVPFFLISVSWFTRFARFLSSTLSAISGPGPIDNTALLDGSQLKLNLERNQDYYIADQNTWNSLVKKYTILGPHHVIMRTSIKKGDEFVKEFILDVYPINLTVFFYDFDESSQNSPAQFSILIYRSNTLAQLYQSILSFLQLDKFTMASLYRVLTPKSKGAVLDTYDKTKTICELGIDDEGMIAIQLDEMANYHIPSGIDGNASDSSMEVGVSTRRFSDTPKTPILLGYSPTKKLSPPDTPPPAYDRLSSSRFKTNVPVGGTGLNNLGNTCYMNSALQCLSNAVPLTAYFLQGTWKTELNPDNPLGMKGQVAEAYANLIQKIWQPNEKRASSFPPGNFKETIGRFNSTFKGYGQQDSQELLNFLLDGLHEDLNRIFKKPYIEKPNMDGKPDAEIGAKEWEIHKQRNDSIVVDLFQGLYKSRVVCTVCGKWSITFDPYMFLSVPIPDERVSTLRVIALPYFANRKLDEQQPVQLTLSMKKNSNMKLLKSKVSDELGWTVDPKHILVVEIFRNRIYKTFDDYDPISTIGANDIIYLMEMGHSQTKTETEKTTSVSVQMVVKNENEYLKKEFGAPFFIAVPAALDISLKYTANQISSPEELYQLGYYKYGELIYPTFVAALRRYSKVELFDLNGDGKVRIADRVVDLDFDKYQPLHGLFKIILTKKYSHSSYSSANQSIVLYDRKMKLEDSDEIETNSFVPSHQGLDPGLERHTDTEMTDTEIRSDMADIVSEGSRPSYMKALDFDREAPEEKEETLNFEIDNNFMFELEFDPEVARVIFGDETNAFAPIIREEKHTKNSEVVAQKKNTTIHQCLQEYSKEEHLGEEDTWYCPQCKEHRQIKKKIDIWTVPEILVIHLKRFSAGRYSSFRNSDKIDSLVEFPLEGLDLSNVVGGIYENEDLVYDLFGVSNHYGGLGGDTAYAKNGIDGNWYHFDDSSVTPVNTSSVMSSAAYLLFYKRRNSKHITLEEIVNNMKASSEPAESQNMNIIDVGTTSAYTNMRSPWKPIPRRYPSNDEIVALPDSPRSFKSHADEIMSVNRNETDEEFSLAVDISDDEVQRRQFRPDIDVGYPRVDWGDVPSEDEKKLK